MSIAYIEQPFRATSKVNNQELLIIALYQEQDARPQLLCIGEDGDLTEAGINDVNFSWRYDNRNDRWVDATLTEVDREES